MERELREVKTEVTSVGSAAAALLRRRGPARVVGVYERAINIEAQDGHMLSVVRRDIGRGPTNVVTGVIPPETMYSLGVRAGESVMLGGRKCSGDGLDLDASRAETYRSKKVFSKTALAVGDISDNLKTLELLASAYGSRRGFGRLLPHLADVCSGRNLDIAGAGPFVKEGAVRLASLSRALVGRRPAVARRAGSELVGLGIGLTPSGDDLLCGLMLTLLMSSSSSRAETGFVGPLCRQIAEAAGTTTRLSQEYIRQAALGEGSEAVVSLIDAVFTGPEPEIRSLAEEVLKMGETSGTDIVCGILLGAYISMELRLLPPDAIIP